MTQSGIFVSFDDIAGFSDDVRGELRLYAARYLGQGLVAGETLMDDELADLVELTKKQATNIIATVSETAVEILRFIVSRSGSFRQDDLHHELDKAPEQLRTIWSGLTRRIRTVTADRDAELIQWEMRNGAWYGLVRPETVASLKYAFDRDADW